MRLRKSVTLAALFAVTLLLAGCPKDKYDKAATAANDLATAIQGAQKIEIQLHQEGLISTDEDIKVQQLLVNVSDSCSVLLGVLKAAHDKQSVQLQLTNAINSVNTLLDDGALHVKNQKAQAELQVAIVTIKGLLDTIAAAVQ